MNNQNSSIPLYLSLVAMLFAIGALIYAASHGGAASAPPSGALGGKTSTAGIYIGGLGFGVGTESSFRTVFGSTGQLFTGGTVNATSTGAGTAVTLAGSDITQGVELDVTVGVPSGLTYTLPASSTLATYIPTVGQSTTLTFQNATNAPGVLLTLSSGTGIVLQVASTSGSTSKPGCKTGPTGYIFLDLLRQSSTSIAAFCTPFN